MSCALELSKTNKSKKRKLEKKVGEVIKRRKKTYFGLLL